jgi:hypothetical protein
VTTLGKSYVNRVLFYDAEGDLLSADYDQNGDGHLERFPNKYMGLTAVFLSGQGLPIHLRHTSG